MIQNKLLITKKRKEINQRISDTKLDVNGYFL